MVGVGVLSTEGSGRLCLGDRTRECWGDKDCQDRDTL